MTGFGKDRARVFNDPVQNNKPSADMKTSLPTLLALVCSGALSAHAQQKTITPGDNLVVEGIPPIPAEMVEQVGRYTEARPAAFPDWHPTKPEMLIGTRFGDTAQVHLVNHPGGARTQLTFFPDRVDAAQYDPIKGASFVFSKGAGGNEFNQNYRYDFATGEVTLLTDGKSRNSSPAWSNKGGQIAYTSTRRNGADTDIYLETPSDPKSDRLLAEVKGGGWQMADWSPDDNRLLVLEYVSINESYLWLFDTKTGAEGDNAPRRPRAPKRSHTAGALCEGWQRNFRHDGSRLGISTPRLHRSRDGKHIYLLPNAKWDVDDWDLSRDGKRIAYTLNENGTSTLHMVEIAAPKGPSPRGR